MTRKMHKYVQLILVAFLVTSCNSNAIYDQYQAIENHKWSSNNKIEFIVSNLDTISKKNVFINIRNNKTYEFSSIFLIAKIEFPKGLIVIDTLEYEMADAQGKWLGTGYTDIKENKLFYKENIVFKDTGAYKFSIQQVTRSIHDIEGENPLQGITDVGLSIENIK